MHLANSEAVLSLLGGVSGCDPAFFVWARFRVMRRYLAFNTAQVDRIFRMLDRVAMGSPHHGSVHLVISISLEIGWRWDPGIHAWNRPGPLVLFWLVGHVQHFKE